MTQVIDDLRNRKLCSDQGLKGKLVELIHHMKEEPQKTTEILSQTMNIQKTQYIPKNEVYSFAKRKRKQSEDIMRFTFDEETPDQSQLEEKIGLDRYERFTKEKVAAYYKEKLKDQSAGKLKDIGVKDMDDYIRSILIYVYGRDRKMDIEATLLPNETQGIEEGNFHYPNLLIRKKGDS